MRVHAIRFHHYCLVLTMFTSTKSTPTIAMVCEQIREINLWRQCRSFVCLFVSHAFPMKSDEIKWTGVVAHGSTSISEFILLLFIPFCSLRRHVVHQSNNKKQKTNKSKFAVFAIRQLAFEKHTAEQTNKMKRKFRFVCRGETIGYAKCV